VGDGDVGDVAVDADPAEPVCATATVVAEPADPAGAAELASEPALATADPDAAEPEPVADPVSAISADPFEPFARSAPSDAPNPACIRSAVAELPLPVALPLPAAGVSSPGSGSDLHATTPATSDAITQQLVRMSYRV
jgi:hypothetical protein